MYSVSETLAKVDAAIFGVLLVMTTTFALAGKIPPTGTGKIIPPVVIAAFADAMKAALEQLKLVKLFDGQDTVALLKLSGALPI